MDRTVTTVIDHELCTGCGSCVEVCPSATLELRGDLAYVTGEHSIGCGHCAAVCPAGAVTVGALDPESSRFSTFEAAEAWMPHGAFDTARLVQLMASRRSCRNYRERGVDREVLTDLVKVGATAPSGVNTQRWRFSILPDREAVVALGERVAAFYELLNRVVEHGSLRLAGRLLGHPELAGYYRDHYQGVKEALDERARTGTDPLFYGAPAAILVSSTAGSATPAEDVLLATENLILGAHAMGLGTCLIGYVVTAIQNDPRLRWWLGLEREEVVRAVIAVGYPDEVYERVAGRRTIPMRFIRA